MTVTEFKKKIAQKYETSADNVIISYGDKEYKGNPIQPTGYTSLMSRVISSQGQQQEDESKLLILNVINVEDRSIVKVSFKQKPKGLVAKVTPEVS